MSVTARVQPPPTPAIAVVSAYSTIINNDSSRSLEELIFDTSTGALTAAGLTAEDLDSVVLSGNDQIDGRVISIMPAAGPAGGVDRDTTMIASSGDHALTYAYLRLKAGQGKNVLVVGWAKPSESVDPDRAELMSAEPYLLRPIGMNNTIAAALQASTWAKEETSPEPAEMIAWPLRREDLPARGDAVHAVVLAVEGGFPDGAELAWILDTGWATVSYELGTRDLGDLGSLRLAVEQISARTPDAGCDRWDAVEIGGDSEFAVRAAARMLRIRDGVAINGSGTLREKPTSPHVSGLGRMLAAAEAVRHTPEPTTGQGTKARVTAGIGFNGFAGQGATVMVFSSSKGGAA